MCHWLSESFKTTHYVIGDLRVVYFDHNYQSNLCGLFYSNLVIPQGL